MSKLPQYIKQGWRPHGPSRCRCPRCGASVSTNALARSRHECPPTINTKFACDHVGRTDSTGLIDVCIKCGEIRA